MKTLKHLAKTIAILAILVSTGVVGLADDEKTAAGSDDKPPTGSKLKVPNQTNGKDTDHIADLVARLKRSMGLWKNGIYRSIDLPAGAKAQEVLSKALEFEHKDSPLRKEYKVAEVRKVTVNGGHIAILLDYPDGSRIFLCNYEGSGWWNRFYEVPENTEQDGADQPATAPKSKPEGKEKPKSEAEARSQ